MRPRLSVPVTALVMALARLAPADEPPVSRAAIGDELHGYYGGEKTSAFVIGGFGAATAGAGAVLVTQDSDFARGLGWPLLTMGALELLGAVVYGIQVGSEIDHYEAALARDPAAFRREELDHIHGTTSRFVLYRAVELGLALAGAGVAAYGFASNRDVWKGIGIGVAAEALPFFVIDTFNQARAARYQDDLRRFEPTLAVGVPGASGAWSLSLAGRF